MINDKRILAIIPARAGSKRLPNKNILELSGKPMVLWTIDAAINSKYIDKIILSSDSENILNLFKKSERILLQKRPEFLASDRASSFDVIKYCLEQLDEVFDILVLLQPTSPLRTFEDINAALEFYINMDANSVISVCKTEHSPLWSNTLPKDFNMSGFINKEIINRRSQDLPDYYRLNGAVMISSIMHLLKHKSFFSEQNTFAYIMPKERSVDIDDEYDFIIARALLNNKMI